ncbi:MAG: hypothetical protein ABEJ42_02805 [Halobacteriaceae archaeon]
MAPRDERDWAVAKALLDATHRSVDVLEEHARYAFCHDGEDPDAAELRRRLQQARAQHEEIIADIDAALGALDEGTEGDREE